MRSTTNFVASWATSVQPARPLRPIAHPAAMVAAMAAAVAIVDHVVTADSR